MGAISPMHAISRMITVLLPRGFTATPVRRWAALCGVGCLSVRAAKAVYVSRARHLSSFLASGAIMVAAAANSRRFSQQNPYKSCVSLVELGRTSRYSIVHFEKITTQVPRYRRCAQITTAGTKFPGDQIKAAKLVQQGIGDSRTATPTQANQIIFV